MSRGPGTKDINSEILGQYLPVDTAHPITAPVLPDGVPSCPSGRLASVVPGG